MQKTAQKHTKYSGNDTILKVGHFAKAIALLKWSAWAKIKIPKNMQKLILQAN